MCVPLTIWHVHLFVNIFIDVKDKQAFIYVYKIILQI